MHVTNNSNDITG